MKLSLTECLGSCHQMESKWRKDVWIAKQLKICNFQSATKENVKAQKQKRQTTITKANKKEKKLQT